MRQEPAEELSSDDWSIPWGLELDTSERLDRLGLVLNATYFAVREAGLIPVCAMATGQDRVLLAAVRTTAGPGPSSSGSLAPSSITLSCP